MTAGDGDWVEVKEKGNQTKINMKKVWMRKSSFYIIWLYNYTAFLFIRYIVLQTTLLLNNNIINKNRERFRRLHRVIPMTLLFDFYQDNDDILETDPYLLKFLSINIIQFYQKYGLIYPASTVNIKLQFFWVILKLCYTTINTIQNK